MNTPLVTTLQDLLKRGAKLIPDGGSEFSGYNAKRQSNYLLWRKNCLDAIGQLREKGIVLYSRIANDENGMYFYESSAQKISAVVEDALEIARVLPVPETLPVPESLPVPELSLAAEEAPPSPGEDDVPAPVEETPDPADEPPAPAEETAVAHNSLAEPQAGGAETTPVLVFSSSSHPLIAALQAMFRERSIDCTLVAHTSGAWTSLPALDAMRPLPRYGTFLLSTDHCQEELMALGYVAGRYPWLTLSCLHNESQRVSALLPGVSHFTFAASPDELRTELMNELNTAGYSVSH